MISMIICSTGFALVRKINVIPEFPMLMQNLERKYNYRVEQKKWS